MRSEVSVSIQELGLTKCISPIFNYANILSDVISLFVHKFELSRAQCSCHSCRVFCLSRWEVSALSSSTINSWIRSHSNPSKCTQITPTIASTAPPIPSDKRRWFNFFFHLDGSSGNLHRHQGNLKFPGNVVFPYTTKCVAQAYQLNSPLPKYQSNETTLYFAE